MRRVCFLSMDDPGVYVSDDNLTIEPLRKLGWDAETISWRTKNTDWTKFEVVVIRTTWDYHKRPRAFLKALKEIETVTYLENPFNIVKWNLKKTYLRDLEQKGVKIVPTVFGRESIDKNLFAHWLQMFGATELIIKPVVGASAERIYRLKEFSPILSGVFGKQGYIVQPFMNNILEEGEFSLFYFGGKFSHAILKTPKQGDFRVQEDFGGINKSIVPTARLLTAGEKVLQLVEPTPLYARVDFIYNHEGEFALMELELIEPSLYFRMDNQSPKRFAEAFAKRYE